MTWTPSPNVARLRESATIAVSARAKALRAAGRTILDFGQGEPDFDTPEFIRRAAQRAIDAGATRYTATHGIMPLRQVIADEANALYRGPDPISCEEVVVGTGSKQALLNACFVLFGPGDEVLIPTPSWTSYYEMVELARATAVDVQGDPQDGLKVTPAMLEAAATSRTRGVMLNSPSNPTGAVYDAEELRAILDLAQERGWWILSDEIYRRITYIAPTAPSVLDIATSRDHIVVFNGVAKAYAMTGWRIGWSIAPLPVSAAMGALQSHTTSNPAAVSQHAALAALTHREEGDAAVRSMVAEFRARRDAAMQILGDVDGMPIVRPDGAFYLFMDVSAAREGDEPAGTSFARTLLDEQGVALVPGDAFRAPHWIRMSYASPMADVVEGATRIAAAFRARAG